MGGECAMRLLMMILQACMVEAEAFGTCYLAHILTIGCHCDTEEVQDGAEE